MNLAHVLWLGGPDGSGATDLARALADGFGLQLYVLDNHASAHAPRMPRLRADEPDATLRAFLETSRHRFRLVLEDLRELPDAPPCVVAGTELLPTSVSAVLRRPDQALFVLPDLDEPLTRTFEREARDLRLATVRPDVPLDELLERAAELFAWALSGEADTSP